MRIARLLQGAAAIGALGLGALASLSASAATGVGGGPIAQDILGSGSDTTQFMMRDVDSLYIYADGCAQIPTGLNPPTTTQWLDFSCQAPDPVSTTHTVNTTMGSEIVTLTAGTTADIQQGDQVTGPGIPAPGPFSSTNFVGGIISSTQFFMSNSPVVSDTFGATATATQSNVTISFSHVRQLENYAHDRPREAWFLGSSNGIKQLCGQGLSPAHIDFARSSRGPKAGDCAGVEFVAYTRDAISWEGFDTGVGAGIHNFLNPDATCAAGHVCLTQTQLRAIFNTCTITDWHTVNTNAPVNTTINVYTAQPGSGTRSTFDGFLGSGASSDNCIKNRGGVYQASHIIPENNNAPILANGDQSVAIFPFSFGIWSTQVNGANMSVLGEVDGIAPNQTTIGDLSFPWGRYLYNVYCDSTCPVGHVSSAAAVAYVGEQGWICRLGRDHFNNPLTLRNYHTDLNFIYLNNGFVPVPGGAIGGGSSGADYCRLFNLSHLPPGAH